MVGGRKLLVAALLIAGAVVVLIVSNTGSTAQFFLTIAELQDMGARAQGRNLTLSGAVLGDSIHYDASKPQVTFTMVQVPGDPAAIREAGGIEAVLHAAVSDPALPRIAVVYERVKPDMLRHEAQAIVRGRLLADGRFQADELLLKCPSRYSDQVPDQVE
ncbi:MAG: cytochrome c maturation protein CcmE [Anaerolineae bacterium]